MGLSAEQLDKIPRSIQRSIRAGKLSGAVTLVMRNGKIAQLQTIGKMDENKSMRDDAIFRIASMTKPVTSVAVMMLVEQGKLSLDDPVSKYLPDFKNTQVGTVRNESFELTPLQHQITIRHLLTHTSGITYRFEGFEPWASIYKDAGIMDGLSSTQGTIGDEVSRLAKLPLMHQPGAKFSYGLSTDVLGAVIEVVSKRSLAEFFEDKIFTPLKMHDTHFYLPQEKISRFCAVYRQMPDQTAQWMNDDTVELGHVVFSASFPMKKPQTYYSGGVGLVSTANDYARFLQMLLNKGELEGVRILNQKIVDEMTSNQTGSLHTVKGMEGFGFGFGLFNDHDSVQYGWSGFFNTTFFVDPKKQLIGIFLSQMYPADNRFHERFRKLVLDAVVD
ncbi:MAG TPA: serine hydrolase domain-containing protein [Acidobacteriota bacterium]|nr:serine hydrolase domain-containing protein [Acidobacteriota bacterium]